MNSRNSIEKDLNPAYILHALREGDLRSEEQLRDHFGLENCSVSMWQEAALLSDRDRDTLRNILEELKAAGLVSVDASGCFRVTSTLRALQKALRISLRQLSHRFMSEQLPQAIQIRKTLSVLTSAPQSSVVEDLVGTLREVHTCFINQCCLGAIVLAGRALEISLKHALATREIPYEDNWSLGKLIEKLRKEAPQLVLESGYGRIFDMVAQSLNCAVHPGTKSFTPSDGEMTLVVAAMLVVLQRLVLD